MNKVRVGRFRPLLPVALSAAVLGGCQLDLPGWINDGSYYQGGMQDNGSEQVFEYDTPLASTSPWPQMRRNRFNNGRSPVLPVGSGEPWRYQTGKGIFSTPVIGHDQTVLVGSADRYFYAINPDGSLKWRFETGEVIDSAAAVKADGSIYVPSADGHIYALTPEGQEIWRFQATHMTGMPDENEGTSCCQQIYGDDSPLCHPSGSGPSTWFEGNVVVGKQGTLWAGNDNHRMYHLSAEGEPISVFWPAHWVGFATIWTAPAILGDGSAVFASLNSNVYNIDESGMCHWRTWLGKKTINDMITSSPAISDDQTTAYVGAWDDRLYALDMATGEVQWNFKSKGHIYSSPAISAQGTIYFGSTDGTLYALSPQGDLLWTFDIQDPIRSSPAVAGDGTIFFGAGDGVLYALNPDGTRRWSFNTTVGDRNDLNASPALGKYAVYIGSEDGSVISVPYSYCEQHPDDVRCNLNPSSDLADNGAELYYVTPGSRTQEQPEDAVQRGAVLSFRLFAREDRQTLRARIKQGTVRIQSTPAAEFDIVDQAGGDTLNLIPRSLLAADTAYRITLSGRYGIAGTTQTGRFSKTFELQTVAEKSVAPPLTIGPDKTTALELRNLSPYQPTIIISLNQIGFDSVNFLASVIHESPLGKVLWFVAGHPHSNGTRIDPTTPTRSALDLTVDGASFRMQGSNFELVTGGPPLTVGDLKISSQFDNSGGFDVGSSFYSRSDCFRDIEQPMGLYFWWLSQCNSNNHLAAIGTIRGFPYDGAANHRPAGVDVTGLSVEQAGDQREVVAQVTAENYQVDDHLVAIVLVDDATGKVVRLDYAKQVTAVADNNGNLAQVRLALPWDLALDGSVTAIVVTDLYPLYTQQLPSLTR